MGGALDPEGPRGRVAVDRRLSAALGVAGTGLAMLAVGVGTGLLDGFGSAGLQVLARKYWRWAPGILPASAALGLAVARFHARLLEPSPPAGLMLLGAVRVFVHFACFGFVVLFAFIAGVGAVLLERLTGRSFGGGPVSSGPERWIGLPLWFLMLPFAVLHPRSDEEALPRQVSGRRLKSWLPFVLAAVALLVRMESEETGERVSPYWLTLAASYWLADYLVVAFQLAPAFTARAREGR